MAEFKAPEMPKSLDRQFGDAMEKMVAMMARQFANQSIRELNKSTVEKFADSLPAHHLDAQTGNFARVFLGLAKRVRKKLVDRFSDERLEKLAENYTGKVNQRNKAEFYRRAEEALGINAQQAMQKEGLTFQINAYQLETAQWAKKLRDESLEMFTANSLRVMAEGGTVDDVMEQFEGMVEKRRNHAKMIARTQIGTFNALVTKARATKLGITKAVWVTSRDERVRRCHQVRDRKEFELDKGLYSSCDGKWLLPGQDYNCRCTERLIVPKEEDDE
jgi:SPP1 gp7 family putative phage head morphogenesis protein